MCRNMGEFSYMQKGKIVKGKRLSHWVTYRLIHEKWMYRQDLWLQSDVGHWTLSGSWERKLASWIVPVTHWILLERCSGDQIRKDNVCRFEIKVDSVYFGGKIQVNFFWIFSQNALINSMLLVGRIFMTATGNPSATQAAIGPNHNLDIQYFQKHSCRHPGLRGLEIRFNKPWGLSLIYKLSLHREHNSSVLIWFLRG